MKTGLLALISPHTLEEFFAAYEENEPFVAHGLQDQLKSLNSIPWLRSLDSLLMSWPRNIEAHLPDARDEVSAIETTPKDAKKLFENGMGLLFKEAQKFSPEISRWVEEIRLDLGLPAMTFGRSLVYATPDGKGTAPHFDQNINFVLQLQGTKTWKMAPNHEVIHPMTRHTMGQAVEAEMESYLMGPMPTEMPQDAQTFVLKPGSVLFVPRGYWHSTEAEGDALSLNFTYTPPTWLDLLTTAMRTRLMQSPEWRETAHGVSDPERRILAEKKFDYLLSTLIQDLPYWNADEILGFTDPQE